MPLHRRLPKRGFVNIFKKEYSIVNLSTLDKAINEKKLDAKKNIDNKALYQAGHIRKANSKVKILAKGSVKQSISLQVAKASKKALEIVSKAKGSIEIIKSKPAKDNKIQQTKSTKIDKTKKVKE